ncbi:MAG: DMT family transporter [Lentimicrobium sp.]|jgi:drug/metabolite transporter (DMT)-like permease|nr:DMT family transporter [Lentimicrobium sp.]
MIQQRKGYTFALIATICGSLVYIFSKAALNQVSLPQFGLWWFLIALFWNSLMAAHPKGGFNISTFTRRDYKSLLVIGIFEVIATVAFYSAINIADNPSVPSFLRNLEYLFVTLLGIGLLSERFNKWTGAGGLLILSGSFIISFRESGLNGFMTTTALMMLISTAFYAVRTILVKKHIGQISPVVLAINRAIFLFLVALAFLLGTGDSVYIPKEAFLNILAGSFVGPFLTSIFQYSALRYIQASHAAIVQSTTGLFVLLGALLVFGILPSHIQIAGGLVTIAGVAMMMMSKKK